VVRKKSGPRTERGKSVVRLNPIRHGVLSQTPVIPLVEREEDWFQLRDGIREYFAVEGMMEVSLADTIAMTTWRRYRVVRMETEAIRAYLEEVPEDYRRMKATEESQGWGPSPQIEVEPPEADAERAMAEMDRMLSARLLPGAETAEKVMRYETKFHRYLLQTIHQLLVLQSLRRGGALPLASSLGKAAAISPATGCEADDKRVTRGPRPRAVRRLEGVARRAK
jgi:hypothetical protein